ncbi:MAG TPA: hypothetical protein PKO06_20275, partial [Candidatus Ozemobacteraceae bacterium]|nr:hypothetical protein [Candidatus Ozemobacteraceae bacterium]
LHSEIEQVRQKLAQAASIARTQATTSRLTTTQPGTLLPTTPTAPTSPTGTTPTSSGTTTTVLQERLRALEERMRVLRDQQQKLLIRLNDLRNRLH